MNFLRTSTARLLGYCAINAVITASTCCLNEKAINCQDEEALEYEFEKAYETTQRLATTRSVRSFCWGSFDEKDISAAREHSCCSCSADDTVSERSSSGENDSISYWSDTDSSLSSGLGAEERAREARRRRGREM